MPETEPAHQGPLLEILGAALRDLHKLNVAAAYVPTLANRTTHLTAIQDGLEALSAIIPDVDLLDPPEE